MPGCEQLEETGDGHFDLTFGVPIPAIKGSYTGTVDIVDRKPATSFRMKIDAKGRNGFILADARMRIEPNGGGSVVHYDADAQIGGPAASVGQRVLVGISRRQIQQMMACLDSDVGTRPGLFARIFARLRAALGVGRNREE
jgi:carbon monoxide dehydrogenase subunit G